MDAILQMLIAAREAVATENKEKPSRIGAIVHTKIEEALLWRQHQKMMDAPQVVASPLVDC